MFENTIEEILQKDSFTKPIFIGALARDELPKNINYPTCFVLNTQPRSSRGEHCLAIFFENNQKSHFFDSYGLSPKYYGLDNYLKEHSKNIEFNKTRLQGLSNYCGLYCILFLLLKSRNQMKQFYSNFYLKDFYLNDKLILKLLNNYK